MATIFSAPKSIPIPELDFQDFDGYLKKCEQFKADLKALVQSHDKGKHVGEIISFPVADGNAEYMVVNMKPLRLVHIPLMDAYEFQYVNRLTAKDVVEKIEQQKALEALFSRKG